MPSLQRSAGLGKNHRPVRVGLAGLGGFGSLHAAVLHGLDEAEGVAVCDPVASRLDCVAGRHAVPERCADLEALLAVDGIEAVFLAVPEDLHVSTALRVLESGRHCFVEKPLATT